MFGIDCGWYMRTLSKMKIRRQFSLRGFRFSHSPSFKVSDEEIFRSVYRDYKKETRISSCRFEKVAEYIHVIFRALAKYDVRFEFDPMSIDDDRCEVVSATELKLICELKHLSKRSFGVDGDGANGTVKIRLRERAHRHNIASWDDICSTRVRRAEAKYLNTQTLLDAFTTALGQALRDVWNEHRNVGLVYRVSGNQARIYMDIPDTGYFTVTLIPAIKLTKGAVKGLKTRSEGLLKGLYANEDVSSIYAVAQPNRDNFEDESWHLSYKTLESKIINAEQFVCGRVCLHALRNLLHSPKSPRSGIRALTLSHLQNAVIQEYARHPEIKDWVPAKFIRRVTGIMTSLTSCLKEGRCVDIFSGVNVFSILDMKSLKVIAKDVEHATTKCREKLLRLST